MRCEGAHPEEGRRVVSHGPEAHATLACSTIVPRVFWSSFRITVARARVRLLSRSSAGGDAGRYTRGADAGEVVRVGARGARTGAAFGPNIQELCAMPISEAFETLSRLDLTPVQKIVAEEVLKELRTRLGFLMRVGLSYLTLDRTAPTLSGGELQRIRLAGQIGAGLVGVLYVLDEPSIGLHPRDNEMLLDSLLTLRDMGNTLIVVEHDEATMLAADEIVDFGPGPGVRGGEVVAQGTMAAIMQSERSLTGQYLSGRREIEVPKARRPVVVPRSPKVRKRA